MTEATSSLPTEQSVTLAVIVGGAIGGVIIVVVVALIIIIIVVSIRAKRTQVFSVNNNRETIIKLDDVTISKGSQEAEYEDIDLYREEYTQKIAIYDKIHLPPTPPATLPPHASPTHPPSAEYETVQQPIIKDSSGTNEFDYSQCTVHAATSRQEQTEESERCAGVRCTELALQDESSM